MKHIQKHTLGPVQSGTASVVLPEGAKIVRVAAEDGSLTLWAVCDTAEPEYARTLHLFRAWETMPSLAMNYIGAVERGGEPYFVFET